MTAPTVSRPPERALDDHAMASLTNGSLTRDAGERSPWEIVSDLLCGRWKHAIALGIALGCALGVAGYLLGPVRYASVGRIRIAQTGYAILRESDDTGPLLGYVSVLKTHAILLKTPRVVERALDDADLTGPLFAQRLQARALILNGLEVSVERGAELISVRFEADEPRTPQLVVNAVLRAYNDIYGDQGTERRGHRLQQLRENQRTLQQELNVKRRALSDFMATTEYGAAEIGDVLSMKLVRIEELKQESDLLDLAIGADVGQGDQTEGELLPAEPSIAELEAIDPQIAVLRRERDDATIELNALSDRFYPSHRGYLMAQRAFERLEAKLAAHESKARQLWADMPRRVSGGQGSLAGLTVEELQHRWDRVRAILERYDRELRHVSKEQAQLQEMKDTVATVEDSLAEINATLRLLAIESDAFLSGRISIAEWASIPFGPSKDRRKQLAVVGFGGGIGLGFALFLLIGLTRPRAFSATQLTHRSARYRCLGVVPELPIRRQLDPDATAANAGWCVHQIRNRLEALHERGHNPVYAVSSPARGDGKTNIVLALGWSYAAAGNRTLIVDCDLVGQSLTSLFNLGDREGLREALRHGAVNGRITTLPVPNLSALGVGADSTFGPEAIRRDEFASLCSVLRREYDVVILDTGPLVGIVGVLPIVLAADGVILTVRRGSSRLNIDRCVEDLESLGGHCIGLVLNCASESDCERYASSPPVSQGVNEGSRRHNGRRRTDDGTDEAPLFHAMEKSTETTAQP